MMLRLFLVMFGLSLVSVCQAQYDRFIVKQKHGDLVIEHEILKGETVFGLARMFHVPPSTLTDMNHIGYQAQLTPGTTIDIPIAVYNHINEAPEYMNDVRPLYYVVDGRESISKVVRITGVPQRKIERWNKLSGSGLRDGQELMVGWVLFDATPIKQKPKEYEVVDHKSGDWSTRAANHHSDDQPMPARTLDAHHSDTLMTIRMPRDTERIMSPEEEMYMTQTLQEQRVITEKGPAAFFASKSKSYYAFHNTLQRGTIIKVYNPGTGKWIFAKVIGAVPTTAQYHNCILGISESAKKELGVSENKMFTEITYGVL